MLGLFVALPRLYPSAILPWLSTARLAIQRCSVVSGAYICCCTGVVDTVPPVTSICAHCGRLVEPLGCVSCTTQSDSLLPILRYCTFCISRSNSVSRVTVVPGCGTRVPLPL